MTCHARRRPAPNASPYVHLLDGVGSTCGLAGLVLFFTDVAGPYWPFVVGGLYAVGALAAPPEKVRFVLDDADAETGRLREDLGLLVREVAGKAGRIPPGAMVRFAEIKDVLVGLLDRPDLLNADLDARYEVVRAIRTDLPAGFQTYLNLPGWFTSGRGAGSRRTAADELAAQLDLIAAHVTELAERLYENDAQRRRDQTRYLRDRSGDADRGGLDIG